MSVGSSHVSIHLVMIGVYLNPNTNRTSTLSMTLNISLALKPRDRGFPITEGCAQHCKLPQAYPLWCVCLI